MSVCAERNTGSVLPCSLQQADVQVLSIRIAINLECLVESRSFCKNSRPVCTQPDAEIVNATAGVTKNLNVWVAHCCKVTLGLVFNCPQGGVERAQNKVQSQQGFGSHITFATRVKVQFN